MQVKEYLGHEGPLHAFQEVFPLEHLFGEEEKIARIKHIGQLRYFAQVFQVVLLQIRVVLLADLVDGQVGSTQQVLIEEAAELFAFLLELRLPLGSPLFLLKVLKYSRNLLTGSFLRSWIAKEEVLVGGGHVSVVEQIANCLRLACKID